MVVRFGPREREREKEVFLVCSVVGGVRHIGGEGTPPKKDEKSSITKRSSFVSVIFRVSKVTKEKN